MYNNLDNCQRITIVVKKKYILYKTEVLVIVYNHIKNTWHNTKRDYYDWLVLNCY